MRVFISYRREDTSGQAGRLYDALAKELGQDNVFMDVDTIDIGVEFRHAIESAVTSCDVLFAMIGPRWLTVADSRGERRLSRADDYVRLEIETALWRATSASCRRWSPVRPCQARTTCRGRSHRLHVATHSRWPTARAGNTTSRGS